jgi:hypothetical protein
MIAEKSLPKERLRAFCFANKARALALGCVRRAG